MLEDRYRNLRSMPFDVWLSIDLSRFKRRKGDTEWAGPCQVHAPKKNGTDFSYPPDGSTTASAFRRRAAAESTWPRP